MESTNNPYAPPRARELEVPSDAAPGVCEHVDWACKLIWIGVGVSTLDSMLTMFLRRDTPDFTSDLIWDLIGLIFDFAIAFWFTHYLRDGRNWMRWLATIITLLGILAMAFIIKMMARPMFAEMFAESPMLLAAMVVQIVLSIAQVALINTPAARQWFRARSVD